MGQLGELTGGKSGKGGGKGGAGAGGKSSGIDHIRSIFEKLRGKLPQQQGMQEPLAVSQKSFMTPQQMAQGKAEDVAAAKRIQVQSVLKDIHDVNPKYWQDHPDQWTGIATQAYGIKLPPPKGVYKVIQDKNSPTGWSYGDFDPESGEQIGSLRTGAPVPATARPKAVTIRNGVLTDADGKSWAMDDPNLPPELKAMAQSYKSSRPYNTAAELKKEHPDWSAEQIMSAMQKPSFPRIVPVNDAQGNTLGVNYLQGMTGGNVSVKFVPFDNPIPPKPTATTLTMQQMATTVLPEAKRVSDEIDSVADELGPLAGRWNEVMVGRVGADNPAVAKLQNDLLLLTSAITRTHFGARGGQEYIGALERYFRLSQSPEDLKARIASSDEWLTTYSQMAGQPPKVSTGAHPAGGGSASAGAPTRTYNGYIYTQQPNGTWKRGKKAGQR